MIKARGWFLVLIIGAVLVSPIAAVADLPPGGTFTDDDGNTHEGNIEAIAAEGITKGCNPPDNTFYCPDDAVTRGQMAAFLRRAFGLPASTFDHFTDDDGSTFEGDINALAEAGITKGCNPPANSEFCPDEAVTRGQMAAFLRRAFDYPTVATDFFTDDGGNTFEADINAIADKGVTKGCNPPDNTLYCPNDLVLRDQMASFLARALGLDPIIPPPREDPSAELTVVFLAVAQGDAALYIGPCGEQGLIDVNRFKDDDVLAALDSLGNRDLKWISVSHYDADHLGGVEPVGTATGVNPNVVYDRGGDRNVKDSQTYRNYYDWVTGTGLRDPVAIGDVFTLCSGTEQVTFTVVSVGTDGTAAGGVPVTEENDRGVCLHVEYRDFDLATCGDVNGTDDGSRTDVESAVAASFGDVEVAKVNHHGSKFSSNSTYVNTLSAEVAVISVGKNSFGHPDPTVVARWDNTGDVYQTQHPDTGNLVDGDVTVVTNGLEGFQVSTETGGSELHPLDE